MRLKMWSLTMSAVAFLFLTACASVQMASMEKDAEAKNFKAPPGQSRIYLYRDETLGSAIKVTVSVDGKVIGRTAPHTYFVTDVAPGVHKVGCIAESQSEISVATKKDEVVFVWQEMKMGLISASCAIQKVTPEVGRRAVMNCKRAQEF